MLVLVSAFSVLGCDDETISKDDDPPMMTLRCIDDSECGPREFCTSTGLCVSRDECDDDRPCSNPEQICGDNDGDGYKECFFERCQENAECVGKVQCESDTLIRCVDGRCLCGEPCQGGCPSGQGCCLPTDMCQALPAQCGDLECPRGQFVSVTSTGAWDTGACEVLGETCECVRYPALPVGDIGLYSAMANKGQNTFFSAYNLDYGDLMFGILRQDGITIDWEFVDGIPSSTSAVTGDVDGPRGGYAEPAEDVGLYTDIEIDEQGQPHIVYHDRTNGRLKYAIGTSSGWLIHVIDEVGTAGVHANLVMSEDGKPRVSYLSLREKRGSSKYSSLRLAIAANVSPERSEDWTLRTIEETNLTRFGCDVRCDADEVCRAADRVCFVPSDSSVCENRCGSNEACLNGLCVITETIEPVTDIPTAVGLWPAAGLLSDGTMKIAYYDSILGQLKLAAFEDPDLLTANISTEALANTTDQDEGRFPSLFVGADDSTHISYMNQSQRSVRYLRLDAAGNTLASEEVSRVVSSSITPGGDLLGGDTSIVVDQAGTIRIAFQNGSTGELQYARLPLSGDWSIITLRGNEDPYQGTFGFYTDQVLVETTGSPLISTYRYWLSKPLSNGIVLTDAP